MKKSGRLLEAVKEGLAPSYLNPYLKEALELEPWLLTESQLETQKLWQENTRPHMVEIGCYGGKNLMEMALANPHIEFYGLDITYKRVVKTARKLKKQNLTNAHVVLAHAQTFFTHHVPAETLDGVFLFFPDPWPKDRHEKNSLISKNFAQLMLKSLKKQGVFWLKTDHQPYFERSKEILLEAGFQLITETQGAETQPPQLAGGPYITAFQNLFTKKEVGFAQALFMK